MNANSAVSLFQKANDLAGHGQLQDACKAYREAIALEPNFAEAHNKFGVALAQIGDGANALKHFHEAFTLKPALQEAFNNFAQLLLHLSENGYAPTIIKDNLAVRDVIARAKAAWPERLPASHTLSDPVFLEIAKNSYLLFYLSAVRLRDAEIEQMLTSLRFALLSIAGSSEIQPEIFAFACMLARQCFINEYVFSLSAEELRQANLLRETIENDLRAGITVPAHRLAILAAYFPLNRLPSASLLLEKTWPSAFQALLVQQVAEPQEERSIREELPKLTAVDDEISLKVRGQYEENPYPRWIINSIPARKIPFQRYLKIQFPHTASRDFPKSTDILVAGCGTGSVVVGMGQLLEGANILAVDLSLSSLSYAKRMAGKYHLPNVEFGQADILRLPSLGGTFDVISSTGVMHHMAEPFVAWRGLVSILRPGGYMHIGFYSEIARKEVSEGWAFIKRHGYGKSADEIRRFRQDVIALPDDAPMKRALTSPDFYSLSDVRDLLFHEHELRVTIPEIKQFLAENALEFIGWDLPSQIRQVYVKKFPSDPTMIELDNWRRFEEEFPHTFSQMYKFWAQKAA
jgi:2-polyprenyl-3-methyl-5-hydroxy-6-metoxy-1,4-benzoquinol methylase